MSERDTEFRQQLLNVQEMSPTLRDGYRKEVDAILNPPLTARSAWVGIGLLLLLLTATAMIVRAELVYKIGLLWRIGHVGLAIAFVSAAVLIVHGLVKRQHRHQSVSSISSILTIGAGLLTVVALMSGIRSASDPKATFGAFYAFVFYFACAIWSVENRIAAAELASREQSLRIECRLADLAERLRK